MTLAGPAATIDRDTWGRPYIHYQGKRIAYTRATTLAGTLEDQYNLARWKQRQVAIGMSLRPDLVTAAYAHQDDRDQLNNVCEQAMDAAAAQAKANIGTAVHALCHKLDRGEDVGRPPGDVQRDLDAYQAATRDFKVLHAEEIVVLDDIKVAGTPDRIVSYEGENYIADIKTGDLTYGTGAIAMQLGTYAHGQLYDIESYQRRPLPAVNGELGIVIHLPAGTGLCALHWVDIKAGWAAVQVALTVRQWRNRRDLLIPINSAAAMHNLQDAGLTGDLLRSLIAAAPTVDVLTDVWREHQTEWTDEHTAAAAARKAELLAKGAPA